MLESELESPAELELESPLLEPVLTTVVTLPDVSGSVELPVVVVVPVVVCDVLVGPVAETETPEVVPSVALSESEPAVEFPSVSSKIGSPSPKQPAGRRQREASTQGRSRRVTTALVARWSPFTIDSSELGRIRFTWRRFFFRGPLHGLFRRPVLDLDVHHDARSHRSAIGADKLAEQPSSDVFSDALSSCSSPVARRIFTLNGRPRLSTHRRTRAFIGRLGLRPSRTSRDSASRPLKTSRSSTTLGSFVVSSSTQRRPAGHNAGQ